MSNQEERPLFFRRLFEKVQALGRLMRTRFVVGCAELARSAKLPYRYQMSGVIDVRNIAHINKTEVFPEEVALRSGSGNVERGASIADSGEVFPSIFVRELKDAKVRLNRRFQVAVIGDSIAVPPRFTPAPWRLYKGLKSETVGGIEFQDGNKVLIDLGKRVSDIDSGLFIGSPSPSNWYHWLIDFLPNLHSANLGKVDLEIPLLVPPIALTRAHWVESMNLFLEGRPTRTLSNDYWTSVKRLMWVDASTDRGPHPSTGLRHSSALSMHRTSVLSYRDEMLSRLKIPPHSKGTRRLFLARSSNFHRPYNQDEVIQITESLGYETIYLEKCDFRDSIRLVAEASHVIAPHGAGLAHLLFAPNNARALYLTWSGPKNLNWFSNVGAASGIELSAIEFDSVEPSENSSLLELSNPGYLFISKERLQRGIDLFENPR